MASDRNLSAHRLNKKRSLLGSLEIKTPRVGLSLPWLYMAQTLLSGFSFLSISWLHLFLGFILLQTLSQWQERSSSIIPGVHSLASWLSQKKKWPLFPRNPANLQGPAWNCSHPELTTVSGEGSPLMLRPVMGQAELSDWQSYQKPMEWGREAIAQSRAYRATKKVTDFHNREHVELSFCLLVQTESWNYFKTIG